MTSGVKKWGVLSEIYKASHRANIVGSLYKKPLKQAFPYWAALAIYVCVGAVALAINMMTSSFFISSMLAIGVTAFAIYVWLEFRIAKEFDTYFQYHRLEQYPFFHRTKYLSYFLFTEKLTLTDEFSRANVASLIEWETVRQKRINTTDFFKSPWVLLSLTAFLGLFVEYLKSEGLMEGKYIFFFSLILITLLWVGWLITDFLQSNNKKNLEICRFLEWWELDGSLRNKKALIRQSKNLRDRPASRRSIPNEPLE